MAITSVIRNISWRLKVENETLYLKVVHYTHTPRFAWKCLKYKSCLYYYRVAEFLDVMIIVIYMWCIKNTQRLRVCIRNGITAVVHILTNYYIFVNIYNNCTQAGLALEGWGTLFFMFHSPIEIIYFIILTSSKNGVWKDSAPLN